MIKKDPVSALLEEAAEKKDYFLLRDIYAERSRELPAKEGLYWDAVVNNLFGKEYRSIVSARKYLSAYGEGDGDSAEMLYITAVSQLRRFRYGAAAATLRKLLRLHKQNMDGDELEEAQSYLTVCSSLRRVGPQQVALNGIRNIPTIKTSFGHITVRVTGGTHTGNFIVDTGANFSTVSLSAAREMGLVPASTGVEVGTATGVRLDCGLSHAPQIDIAGITVRNAVFIVMEDGQLSFPELGYSIEGIIGLPVLRQFGSLKFERHGIRIGNVPIPGGIHCNICMEGLMPLAEVHARGERLTFTLDTGANRSEYSHGYYNRHNEMLDSAAREYNGLRGGGGGVVRHKTLMLRGETLTVAGKTLKVKEMNVIREDYEFSRGRDGNLGLDALMSGGSFGISFDRMALYPYSPKWKELTKALAGRLNLRNHPDPTK